MFADIHNHLLPGLDDGPDSWETTRGMLRIAAEEGIRHLACTPHCTNGGRGWDPGRYQEYLDRAREMVRDEELEIVLYPGCELYMDPGNRDSLSQGRARTLNDSRYLLLELPPVLPLDFLASHVLGLQMEGYVVVLAHVERYPVFERKPGVLRELVASGVLLQVNAASLTGGPPGTRRWLRKLLLDRMLHVVATDAHGDTWRPPRMREASAWIEKTAGSGEARRLCLENPLCILEDRELDIGEPATLPPVRSLLNRSLWNDRRQTGN